MERHSVSAKMQKGTSVISLPMKQVQIQLSLLAKAEVLRHLVKLSHTMNIIQVVPTVTIGNKHSHILQRKIATLDLMFIQKIKTMLW